VSLFNRILIKYVIYLSFQLLSLQNQIQIDEIDKRFILISSNQSLNHFSRMSISYTTQPFLWISLDSSPKISLVCPSSQWLKDPKRSLKVSLKSYLAKQKDSRNDILKYSGRKLR